MWKGRIKKVALNGGMNTVPCVSVLMHMFDKHCMYIVYYTRSKSSCAPSSSSLINTHQL